MESGAGTDGLRYLRLQITSSRFPDGARRATSVQWLAIEGASSPYLSASGFVVDLSPLSSPYRNHGNNQNLILYAIDQPVSSTAKLDFVGVSQPSESIGRNVRIDQTCRELFLELILKC